MYKIVAVSYLNTLPFLYGLENSNSNKQFEIQTAVPSMCFRKVLENEVDIGLVPVAAIPKISGYKIVSDYCIGADGAVDTVLLMSNEPLNRINKIYLDNESKTSVELVKVLAKNYWKITPNFLDFPENFNYSDSAVLIGDKTFVYRNKYNYIYDLAFEWKKFTSLPFVFACWVARNTLENAIIQEFNLLLKKGVDNIDEVINYYKNIIPENVNAKKYYSECIDYKLTQQKLKAMEYFFTLIKEN